MHRLLSSLEEISVGASSSVRDGAQKAVQAIIDDLAEKRIELAWTASDEADVSLTLRGTARSGNLLRSASLC